MSIDVENNASPALRSLAEEIANNAVSAGVKKTAQQTVRQITSNIYRGIDESGAEQKQNAESTFYRKKMKGRGVLNKPLIGDEQKLVNKRLYRIDMRGYMATIRPPASRQKIAGYLTDKGYKFMEALPALISNKPFMSVLQNNVLNEIRKARKKAGI